MRTKTGRIVKLIGFLALAFFLWLMVRDTLVMKRDDGITSMKIYYEQPADSVDVLFAGSSHSSYNIAAEELWNRYGISFYQLWGSSQPMWNTYHFLIEAFKTQQPKVVMLDVYGALMEDEYSDDARQATNTLGLKLSRNMLENIMVSAPKERWGELFLGLPIYHDRFSELAKDDFIYYPWSKDSVDEKGSFAIYGTHDNVKFTPADSEERLPLSAKQETWLRKIIALCGERNIPLVLMVTPTVDRAAEQGYYNTISDICVETGTPFLNMNRVSDVKILPSDISYDDSHLNMTGARKTGAYLAEYLHAHYELPDHRGEEQYSSWESYAQKRAAGYLRLLETPREMAEEIRLQNYSVLLVRYGNTTGREHAFNDLVNQDLPKNEGCWLIEDHAVSEISLSPEGTANVYDTDISISFSDRSFAISLTVDPVWKDEGVIAAVYDRTHRQWIDAVYIPADEAEPMEHLEFRSRPD